MIFSRFLTAVCIGILIPAIFGVFIRLYPDLNSMYITGLCLILTYSIAGAISIWSTKEYPYMAATLVGTIVCIFQYSFTVFWIVGDMIFTPDIFAFSLVLAIAISNLGAWLHLKRTRHVRMKGVENYE